MTSVDFDGTLAVVVAAGDALKIRPFVVVVGGVVVAEPLVLVLSSFAVVVVLLLVVLQPFHGIGLAVVAVPAALGQHRPFHCQIPTPFLFRPSFHSFRTSSALDDAPSGAVAVWVVAAVVAS